MMTVREIYYALDRCGIRLAGTNYVRFFRDVMINERFEFITAELKRLEVKDINLLDVGCGSGFLLAYLDRQLPGAIGHYSGIDLQAANLNQRFVEIKTPHSFRNMNLDESWDKGTYDAVVCLEVIEHLINDDALMKKMSQSLKPNGYLFLTTPSLPFIEKMGEKIAGFSDISSTQDGGHVRRGYERKQLEILARKYHLIPERFGWISQFSEKELKRYLRFNFPLGYIAHNVLFPRSSSHERVAQDSDNPNLAELYWSIGMVCRKDEMS